jgi:hypothetical protein
MAEKKEGEPQPLRPLIKSLGFPIGEGVGVRRRPELQPGVAVSEPVQELWRPAIQGLAIRAADIPTPATRLVPGAKVVRGQSSQASSARSSGRP